MNIAIQSTDYARLYGECILFWMLEHAPDGQQIEDHEMQEGSGLPDAEFKVGLNWLVENRLLDRHEDTLH